MKLKQLLYRLIPPCPECPYKLGLATFVKNPCPECKANNYATYERLITDKYKGGYANFK